MKKKREFYRVLEGDGTTYGGFKNSTEIGGTTKAPDWDSHHGIDCGKGLHVVEGHPLMAFGFVHRANPIFFKVETCPNPPVMSAGGGKYRCEKVINKIRLTEQSPEFRQEVLARLAKKTGYGYWRVREAAIKMLDSQKYAQLLAQIAKEDDDRDVRRTAEQLLKNEL